MEYIAYERIIKLLQQEKSREWQREKNLPWRRRKNLRNRRKVEGEGDPLTNIARSILLGQADHYRLALPQFWPKLGPRLLAAQSPEEIVQAIREDAPGITGSLDPFTELILNIVHDPKFPRTRPKSQIHFLSDSLGGQGLVTPRRSREICAQERTKVRHVIVRREYYVECSCGYQGPALDVLEDRHFGNGQELR